MATNGKVGVRHILDVEEQDWILREDVARGYKSINRDQESKFPFFDYDFQGSECLKRRARCLIAWSGHPLWNTWQPSVRTIRTLNNLFATSSKVSKLEDGCRSHRQTSNVTGPRGSQGVEVMFEFSWQHKTPPSTGVCHQYLSTIHSNLIDKIYY